jgi:hypothetical protein
MFQFRSVRIGESSVLWLVWMRCSAARKDLKGQRDVAGRDLVAIECLQTFLLIDAFGLIGKKCRPDAALTDHMKSLDWVVRKARHKGKVASVELAEVMPKILALIGKA